MNLTEARQIVVLHPSKIGRFKRSPVKHLFRVVVFNWLQYYDLDSRRLGGSIGDGKVYALKLEKREEGGKVLVPDLSRIYA
jgi:hypothetical protein